jgi:hypothetical protein
MASQVNWYAEKVTAIFVEASMKVLCDLAFIGEGDTKVNITDNDQVDTGFMVNSVYAVTPGKSSYGNTKPTGEYEQKEKTAEGEVIMAHRVRAESVQLPNDQTVAVAVAAEYAIYQEMAKPFLFPAIEGLAKKFNGVVERNKVTT